VAGRLGALAAALAAAGCGDSASVALPPSPPATSAPARAPGTGPAVPAGYAGLGAPAPAFARAHPPPSRRSPGVPAASGVRLDAAGRVTAWTIAFADRPPLSDYERLVDAAGVSDLPRDRITVASARDCLVYGSPALKRLIGVSYASVTTVPGARTAQVQGTATPAC
jgi:hypothetical protein